MTTLKILVVDDDPVTRTLLTKRLMREDYTVETAENGVAALEKIGDQFYDVVLTDLIMPGGVDGIGVLERAKQRHVKTEVILITAHATVENAIEAMQKGAVDYLQKPIHLEELILRLEKIHNLKMLVKNASDLREAMDVTEKNAAQTIQDLELTVADLNRRLDAVRHTLQQAGVDPQTRIAQAVHAMGDG